jgi:hypothetical protein
MDEAQDLTLRSDANNRNTNNTRDNDKNDAQNDNNYNDSNNSVDKNSGLKLEIANDSECEKQSV